MVPEDIDVGSQVLRLVATDADEQGSPNSELTYYISHTNGDPVDEFEIDKDRGT